MDDRRPIAPIIMEFMGILYKMLIYIQPTSGVSDYIRSDLIVNMNRLIDEMKPYVKDAEALEFTKALRNLNGGKDND